MRSWISWFSRSFSAVALATFRILPRKGRIAWVSRLRAALAEPPAESPSTRKISVPSAELLEQSASLPGSRSLRVAVLRCCSRSWRRRSRSSALATTCSSSTLPTSLSPVSQCSQLSAPPAQRRLGLGAAVLQQHVADFLVAGQPVLEVVADDGLDQLVGLDADQLL